MNKFITLIICCFYACQLHALPTGFVYLKDIDPSIIEDIKYHSSDNFIGRRIKGYNAAKCILTYQAAYALSSLQKELNKKGMGFKVYDCYRPTMAVKNFIEWSQDIQDQQQKNEYYPHINKADFFKLGYVAEKSGHSRGSTIDLTIVRFTPDHKAVELNMGTHFDFMDETSHPLYKKSVAEVWKNRIFLRSLMLNGNFNPFPTEWWHFTLKDEPFPKTYFNFPVE